MAKLKALICGGGIAGNALAFWLSTLGHDVTVIERFLSLRDTGLQIDLRGHGIEVLKHMGFEKAFFSKSAPEEGFAIVNSSGKRWAYFPANRSGKGLQNFTSEYEIMRGDLVRLIYNANKDGVRYIFDLSITTYEETASLVKVQFSDGTTDEFDLLIGADGQWSRTRRMMIGPDNPDPMYLINNTYGAYFVMPSPVQKGEQYVASIYLAAKNRGIMVRRHNPANVQVYLTCKTTFEPLKTARRGDTKAEKEAFAEIFKDAGWKIKDILQAMDHAPDFYCERLGVVKLDSWSKGRVVLLGDAAYCPSANTGMGTTSSFVGAYILAGEIDKHCNTTDANITVTTSTNNSELKHNLTHAFQCYETRFRPFMDQVQKGVVEDSGFTIETWWGVVIFNFLAGVASFLRLNVGSWFLKEAVKGWDLPAYENMLSKVHR